MSTTFVGPATRQRQWYATADGTPFCVDPILWPMLCAIPVLPGGDGAETEPLVKRTSRCRHRTYTLVGSAPTCGHHLVMVLRIAGVRPREAVPTCPE